MPEDQEAGEIPDVPRRFTGPAPHRPSDLARRLSSSLDASRRSSLRGRGRSNFDSAVKRRNEAPFDPPNNKRPREAASFGSEGEVIDPPVQRSHDRSDSTGRRREFTPHRGEAAAAFHDTRTSNHERTPMERFPRHHSPPPGRGRINDDFSRSNVSNVRGRARFVRGGRGENYQSSTFTRMETGPLTPKEDRSEAAPSVGSFVAMDIPAQTNEISTPLAVSTAETSTPVREERASQPVEESRAPVTGRGDFGRGRGRATEFGRRPPIRGGRGDFGRIGRGRDIRRTVEGRGRDFRGQFRGRAFESPRDHEGRLLESPRDLQIEGRDTDGRGGFEGRGNLEGRGRGNRGSYEGRGRENRSNFEGRGRESRGGFEGRGRESRGGFEVRGRLDGRGRLIRGNFEGRGREGRTAFAGRGRDIRGVFEGRGRGPFRGAPGRGRGREMSHRTSPVPWQPNTEQPPLGSSPWKRPMESTSVDVMEHSLTPPQVVKEEISSPVKQEEEEEEPRSPSPPLPEPAETSGLVKAMITLAELEAKMQLAYSKYKVISDRHSRIKADYDIIEKLPVGFDAFKDDFEKLKLEQEEHQDLYETGV